MAQYGPKKLQSGNREKEVINNHRKYRILMVKFFKNVTFIFLSKNSDRIYGMTKCMAVLENNYNSFVYPGQSNFMILILKPI